jgi:membrane fusion protein (multidrug efflux system)
MNERLRLSKKGWLSLILLALLLPLGGYYGIKAWAYYSTHVTTDNAYVHADSAQITPRIAGTVEELLVEDNWQVKPGQVLVRLDPQDARVHLAQAEAALARAKETADQLFVAVEAASEREAEVRMQVEAVRAEVMAAQAEFHQAELDLRRAQELAKDGVIPSQQFDRAQTHYDTTQSRLRAKQRQLEQTQQQTATRAKETEHDRAALGSVGKTERSSHSLIQQAEAAVREAELNLSYCTIVSPIEGVVSRKAIEVGQRVQPGQPLMAVVPLHDVYIEANYKETQLTDVRVGQPVEITADIYPGYIYRGTVESLSAGTGAAFSLLPPENATGNWVKVVQRLPVKILLQEPPPTEKPLRVGLSVEVSIDTSNRQGPFVSSLRQQQTQQRAALLERPAREPSGLTPTSAPGRGGQ